MKILSIAIAFSIFLLVACTKEKNNPAAGEPEPDTTVTASGLETRKYLLRDSSFFVYSDASGFYFIDSGTVLIQDTLTLKLQLLDSPRYLIYKEDTVEETSEYANTVFHYSPSLPASHLVHTMLYPDSNSFMVKHLYYYGGHTKSTVTLSGSRIY